MESQTREGCWCGEAATQSEEPGFIPHLEASSERERETAREPESQSKSKRERKRERARENKLLSLFLLFLELWASDLAGETTMNAEHPHREWIADNQTMLLVSPS